MQTCIWAETDDFGGLSVDLSGFSGMTCLQEKTHLEHELKKRGVRLQTLDSKPHGRPEGGALVRRLKPLFPEFKKWGIRSCQNQKQRDRIALKR